MQEETAKLQQEAENLAQQLRAVLNDQLVHRSTFDADTPIDKTLGFLQNVICVSSTSLHAVLLYGICSMHFIRAIFVVSDQTFALERKHQVYAAAILMTTSHLSRQCSQ